MIGFARSFERNFLATRADSPPVEADPATNSVMVAIHAGHIAFPLLLRSYLSFSYRISLHFNHTTKETSRFRTAISNFIHRSAFGLQRKPVVRFNSSLACSSADFVLPPNIRASSSIRFSPVTSVSAVRVRPPATVLLTLK
jgi:hypothetical protein